MPYYVSRFVHPDDLMPDEPPDDAPDCPGTTCVNCGDDIAEAVCCSLGSYERKTLLGVVTVHDHPLCRECCCGPVKGGVP